MAECNLLREDFKNNVFAVSFDFYTPRPHFMILPKNIESIDPEFSRMTNDETRQLIEVGISALANFRIRGGILSIHRGSWKDKKSRNKFLVHLCVDVGIYLEVFERRKKAIPNWPSVVYVTKQWKWNKDPRSYAQNVRGYPYTSYFKEEVAAIIDLIQAKSSSDEPGKSAPQSALGGGITQIVYHARHPKIGFVGKKTDSVVEELQKVLLAMEEFAREHGLTNLESNHESDGCHLCLHLGSGTYIYTGQFSY